MRQAYFLNSTCDMAINKRQRHATLPFLKSDMRHWGPPRQGPLQSLPLHSGPSLNCPGETAELWQNPVELASGKDLNTFKGPNTQVPAELSLSKQIVSQLLYKYVWVTQILQGLLLGDCVGRLKLPYTLSNQMPVVLNKG